MSGTHTDNPSTPSLSRFGAAALGLLHNHVELLGLELQEQKIRFGEGRGIHDMPRKSCKKKCRLACPWRRAYSVALRCVDT